MVSERGVNLAAYLKQKSFEEKMVLLENSPKVQRIIKNKELSDYWETMSNQEIIEIE